LIELNCVPLVLEGGRKTGYVWAVDVVDPKNVKLSGPAVITIGLSHRDASEMAASIVLEIDRQVLSVLRHQSTGGMQ
jgi:hypothetical protein